MQLSQDQLDPSIFRAYDIRGIVDQSLTCALAHHLGRAFAAEAKHQQVNHLVVAGDGRLSSPQLKEALIQGLLAGGMDVQDIGFVPTPVLYFAAHQHSSQSGIMVTGSHNPANYNGFKMMLAGNTLAQEEIQSLKQRIQRQDYGDAAQQPGQCHQLDISTRYRKRIRDDIRLQRPLKVVVDCGNGIAGNIAPALLAQLGCDVIPLYCEVDGHFPNHHPDPGKLENLRDCIAAVRAEQADLGLAFDGDGDRVGVVDETGQIIVPDRLLMLFAEDILTRNPGSEVIYDVKCSRWLHQVIEQAGGKACMWKTGHSLIKRRMKASGALLAGEMSGHIFFKERWFGFDDGLYSAARLLEILSQGPASLSELFARYPTSLSTPEINIAVDEARKFDLISALQAHPFPDANVSLIDGLRVDYPDGWGLIRASNTTPMLVLRFEADNQAALQHICTTLRAALQTVAPDLSLPFDNLPTDILE